MAREQIIDKGKDTYEIITDAPPEAINEIAQYIYLKWIAFARGATILGGNKIEHPTGRYESSIKLKKDGNTSLTIYADTKVAKHAEILSLGHKEYDMKNDIFMGRSWPMHRFARVFTGFSPLVPQSKKGDRGWIIPAMQGMHPVRNLTDLASKYLKKQ